MKYVNGTTVMVALQTELPGLSSLPGAALAVHACVWQCRNTTQTPKSMGAAVPQLQDGAPFMCGCTGRPQYSARVRGGTVTLFQNPSTNPPRGKLSHKIHLCSVKLYRQVLLRMWPADQHWSENSWLNVHEGIRSLHQNVHHCVTRLTV